VTTFPNPFPPVALPKLRHPTTETIVSQVRFPASVELLEPNGIAPLHKLLRKDYPHLRREDQLALQLSATDGPVQERASLWRLEDPTHQWTATITSDYIAMEAKDHRDFPEFRDRMVALAQAFVAAYNPPVRTRVGLRYVDRISTEKYPYLPPDWPLKVNLQLFHMVSIAPDTEQRSFVEHRVAVAQNQAITFRAVLARTKPEGKDFGDYVLDVDVYDESETDTSTLSELLDAMKIVNYSAFGWATGQALTLLERS
jgi:uncharacterized protein (TIGR04255 family)